MTLCDALKLPARGQLCLVGGGGKSTLMHRLADELTAQGRRVVVTTTTHILREQGEVVGPLLTAGGAVALSRALERHSAACIATPSGAEDKLTAPPEDLLRAAATLADWIIAEADGARHCPVKAPAPHEPVLLEGSIVVAVAGLSALGRPLVQGCHRPELAAQVLCVPVEAILTPALLARLLTSERGQRKGVTGPDRFRIVLNQADSPQLLALGRQTAAEIKDLLPHCPVVLTALREPDFIKEVI